MEPNNKIAHYLVFTLSDRDFALPLPSVERVVHAVAVTVVPEAPEILCGLINYKGFIMPVLDISLRFQLPNENIGPDHLFVIVHTAVKSFALKADGVRGVLARQVKQIVPPADIISGMRFLAGVMKLENGMMLVPDLERLLTYEEETAISALVENHPLENGDNLVSNENER